MDEISDEIRYIRILSLENTIQCNRVKFENCCFKILEFTFGKLS
jgi:hypothetical protein